MPGKERFTFEQKQEMCRLYQEGMSTTEVAKQFGCSGETVSAALRANGIKTRLAGRMKSKDSGAFDQRLAQKNPSLIRLGSYQGARTKILFRCEKHEEEHEAIPDNLMRGQGLKCCAKAARAATRAATRAAKMAATANAKNTKLLFNSLTSKAIKMVTVANINPITAVIRIPLKRDFSDNKFCCKTRLGPIRS